MWWKDKKFSGRVSSKPECLISKLLSFSLLLRQCSSHRATFVSRNMSTRDMLRHTDFHDKRSKPLNDWLTSSAAWFEASTRPAAESERPSLGRLWIHLYVHRYRGDNSRRRSIFESRASDPEMMASVSFKIRKFKFSGKRFHLVDLVIKTRNLILFVLRCRKSERQASHSEFTLFNCSICRSYSISDLEPPARHTATGHS